MEELLIVSDNCDGMGVMNKRGTWWYLCFRKSRRMGGCVAENAVHIKYSWTALHFLAFCEIRSVPQNGVLAKWIWAEICKILLGLTVLKSSMSSSSVKSMEATCFRGCKQKVEEVSLTCVRGWFKWECLFTASSHSLSRAYPLLQQSSPILTSSGDWTRDRAQLKLVIIISYYYRF